MWWRRMWTEGSQSSRRLHDATSAWDTPAARSSRGVTFGAVRGDIQEDQTAEEQAENERGPRHAVLVHALEDPWSLTLHREAVERARADVQIRIRGGEHEDEHAAVDDVVQHLRETNGQKGGLGGETVRGTLIPARVVATTNGEAAAPVFDLLATNSVGLVDGTISPMTKTPTIGVRRDVNKRAHVSYRKRRRPKSGRTSGESPWLSRHRQTSRTPRQTRRNRTDVLPRVLGFPDCHTDQLSPDVRKERVRERRPEPEEDRQLVVVHLS